MVVVTEPQAKHDIVVVRWPSEQADRERLADQGRPRLLLVAPDAEPPDGRDCLEDWIRLPAEDRDVAARLHSLEVRAARHQPVPEADEHHLPLVQIYDGATLLGTANFTAESFTNWAFVTPVRPSVPEVQNARWVKQPLDAFVASLASRDAPINEPWTSPLWHQPLFFLAAIACLAAEWGLRRVNGLA